MGRSFALHAEIVRRGDESPAEKFLPKTIHGDACGERVIRGDEPLGKREPRRFVAGRQRRQDARHCRRNVGAAHAKIAAHVNVSGPRVPRLAHRRCAGQFRKFGREFAELRADRVQFEFGEFLAIDDRPVFQKIIEQPVPFVGRAPRRREAHDLGRFELPLAQLSPPNQTEHFPPPVPQVIAARVRGSFQQLRFPPRLPFCQLRRDGLQQHRAAALVFRPPD